MYRKIADKISNSLVSSGSISDSEVPVYSYAAELFLSSITGLAICMSIGFIFGSPFGSLVFLFVYCPLRQFSGGYHASNHIACASIFCAVFMLNTLVARYLIVDSSLATTTLLILTGCSILVVIILCPVEDRNKRLSQIEKVKYKRTAITLSLLTLCLITLFVKLHMFEATYYACSAVLILSVLLIAGKTKNSKGEKMKKMFAKATPVMALVLMTLATASVNSASWWMIYQPEIPKELMKKI